jgi:SPP1 family predicted phage head-tail adaptor
MPAQVKELAGKELELSRQYLPTASHEVIIRWHPDVTSQCRVAWGDRTLAIGYVKNPDNRKNWLHLTCEELL